MTTRSITHATFTLERTYAGATPARVFDAFAKPAAKARWFSAPAPAVSERVEMDFRVGGHEVVHTRMSPGGPPHTFVAHYHDLVPAARIIYAYDMLIGDVRISASLATIELHAAGTGTRIVMTEQGAFLDGYDDAGARERGTNWLLDQLGASLMQ